MEYLKVIIPFLFGGFIGITSAQLGSDIYESSVEKEFKSIQEKLEKSEVKHKQKDKIIEQYLKIGK